MFFISNAMLWSTDKLTFKYISPLSQLLRSALKMYVAIQLVIAYKQLAYRWPSDYSMLATHSARWVGSEGLEFIPNIWGMGIMIYMYNYYTCIYIV